MKAYTDLQQSKKLAKILPIDTADCCYIKYCTSDNNEWRYDGQPPMILGEIPITEITAECIPCWSLVALLNLFPCSKESPIVNLTRGGWNPSFTRQWFATWEDEDKNVFYSCDGNSPVDAVAELILKLHEENSL